MNLRGTQDPTVMRIQLEPILKTLIASAEVGDIDEILPPAPVGQQMPGQQMMQPGLPPQPGIPGLPQGVAA